MAAVVAWHALGVDEALSKVNSTENGLTKPEAAERLTKYGKNVMTPGKRRTVWHMIWEQLYSIITGILLAAAIIAGVFHEWIEMGFVLAVILANVSIGVIQEGRAEAATAAIRNLVSSQCVCMRNGRKNTVDTTTLVPGDVVHLTAGDRIPADIRWLQCTNVQVTEAMLTGESTPIGKSSEAVAADAPLGDRTDMGFMGTLVFTGQGTGLVVATGDAAEIGRINTLMATVETVKTPLLVQIERFGFGVSVLCIVVALITFIVAKVPQGLPLQEAFKLAVSVAVSLIPEGLPTTVLICLSLGVQEMSRNKAIIRQLPAVETLGALTVICSDKTGTLTKNEMTCVGIHTTAGIVRVSGSGYNPDGELRHRDEELEETLRANVKQLLLPAALCNDSTLMPTVSAHAQNMLLTQAVALPAKQMGTEGAASAAAAVHVAPGADAHAAHLPARLEVKSPEVGTAITRAMTAHQRHVTWNTTGDPTEAALLAAAMKAGLNLKTLNVLSHTCPRLGCLPFSSEHKFMATVHDVRHPETGKVHRLLMVKGAPDVLLARCIRQAAGGNPWTSEPLQLTRWLDTNSQLSKEGMRVLALCIKELPISEAEAAKIAEKDAAGGAGGGDDDELQVQIHSSDVLKGEPSLQLNCLMAIVDPPREEAITAIKSCHSAGITVKMITGDHADTAKTIGTWIGIGDEVEEGGEEDVEQGNAHGGGTQVITGPQLEAMSDAELEARVERCNIFARASPEHKLRIVKALQKHGHIVAMTGDGVNDAPALKQAAVGVAMGITGSEVAKDASKMILTDDNFATLETAVKFGRATYSNLRKLMLFLLPTSIAQGGSIAVSVFMDSPTPLTAVQILYVNMISASTLGLVLAAEAPEPSVMQQPPREQGKPLVGKLITWRSIFVGAALIVAMLGQQAWTLALGGSQNRGHTMAMNTLVISQCLYCVSCRFVSESSLNVKALYTNSWLTAMVLLNVALQCLITYTPGVQDVWETEAIDGIEWLRILLFAVAIFLLVEVEKKLGPAFVRPYIMPAIKHINALFGCARRAGPKPYVMRTDAAGIAAAQGLARQNSNHAVRMEAQASPKPTADRKPATSPTPPASPTSPAAAASPASPAASTEPAEPVAAAAEATPVAAEAVAVAVSEAPATPQKE